MTLQAPNKNPSRRTSRGVDVLEAAQGRIHPPQSLPAQPSFAPQVRTPDGHTDIADISPLEPPQPSWCRETSWPAQRALGTQRHSEVSRPDSQRSSRSTLWDQAQTPVSTLSLDTYSCSRQLWDASATELLQLDVVSGTWRLKYESQQTLASASGLPPQKDRGVSKEERGDGPSATPASGPPSPSFSKPHEILFIITVCLAQFLSLGGLAQTVAPLLIIGDSFRVYDPGQLSWFTAAFSLTVGTFILPAGRLGDMFGHRRVYMIGWAWYSVWSVACGFCVYANNIAFSICRAFQGIGPALLVPNAMALVGRNFPVGTKRNVVFSLFGAMGPTGWVAGATVSSILAQLAWWPWAFWVLGAVCAFVLWLAQVVIPPPLPPLSATPVTPPVKGPPKFDFLGAATGVPGLILFNFAVNQAPLVAWSTPYILVALVLGLLFLSVFIYIELWVSEQPLIPMRGLNRDAVFTLACIAAGWSSHGIWIYYLYLFLESIRGHSPLSAVAQTSPVAVTGLAFALSTSFLLKKVRVSYVMVLAMLFFLLGAILLATAPAEQTYWAQTFLSILLMPGGMNLSFPAGTILMSNALTREHQGITASLVATMVNYSISCGLGFAATVDVAILGKWDGRLERNGPPTRGEILRGFRGAWWSGVALSGVGLAISAWFVWKSREGGLKNQVPK